MKVKFWGTRGSIPVPGKDTIIYGGNTTCIEITLESGRRIIIDAGTGIRSLGEHLANIGEELNIVILITHIHWDHIIGFPFFTPIFNPSTKIEVDGIHTCMKGIKHIFDYRLGDGFFPIKFNDLKAEISHLDKLRHGPVAIDGAVIDTIPLQHPQGGFGYRFREGSKSLAFITDNELTEDAWKGSRPGNFVRFCRDVDLLIHDAQYSPQEIGARKGWGHSDYSSAVDLALESNAGKLLLFHHDPSRNDEQVESFKVECDRLVNDKGSDLPVDAAIEETELKV